MSFIQAMNSPDLTKIGVNGEHVLTEAGVEDLRVTLFTMLNRGLDKEYIDDNIQQIINRNITQEICDLLVMTFQTRDVRGGKGERMLFYNMFNSLFKYKSDVVSSLLNLIPEYGCWRDMIYLAGNNSEIQPQIFEIIKTQLGQDLKSLEEGKTNKLSLLAKWLPREKSSQKELAKKIAKFCYPSLDDSLAVYRQDISNLNKALKTVEIDMCSENWSNIKPESVPGRCLKLHNKAFLNLPDKRHRVNESNGVYRYPLSEDRMECRQHFEEFSQKLSEGKTKAKGAHVVMPHELVKQILPPLRLSKEEISINQGQWNAIREETLKGGGLGKCVPMCDFSGSMNGDPLLISLSLGILISEINHPSFRDHILTFDTEPKWYSFTGKNSLKEKLDSVCSSGLGQGLNTDFYKACLRIIDKMVENRVPVGEEPEDLIVLTDMGFDEAAPQHNNSRSKKCQPWESQLQKIRQEFKKAGEKLWGKGNGWKQPRIVIWNLRAEYKDFHAKAHQEGVVQLSGWSPSILKALQKGGVQVMTPYQGMRAVLDDKRYDKVREVFYSI